MDKSKQVNRVYYKTHGHTAIGVDPLNYKQHILEYNDFVFSNVNYAHLKHNITKDNEDALKRLTSSIKDEKYGLFTNAPLSWCENICWSANVDIYSFIDDTRCFTSDDGLIKPKKQIYEYVESELNDEHICFIDDNEINFKEISNKNRWETLLFNPYEQNLCSLLESLTS